MLVLLATSSTVWAQYAGPIVDAHSQFGCEITAAKIRAAIEKNGVAHTLLSARGCRGEQALASHRRVLKLVESLDGQASFLISTKLAGMSLSGGENGKRGLLEMSRADKQYFDTAVGFAEILVQHAPHETNLLRYGGLGLNLQSKRIEKAIALALGRKGPVILHLELNDYEKHSARILGQLSELLAKNPDSDFVLIHMAQASVSEARQLIETHEKVHFLTTTADALAAIGKKVIHRKKQKAQIAWVNMFNDPPDRAPYTGWLADYLPAMQWRDDWKRLIEAHPDRFVFAMENVFGPHWTKRYPVSLKIWRKAFSLLSEKSARMVACANAKRLWKLEVACEI